MYESESASFIQSFNSSESVPVDDQYAAKSMPHKVFYTPGGVGQQLSPNPTKNWWGHANETDFGLD
jgi:hypothetical protein